MQRLPSRPRDDWQKTVESQGFYFHTAGDQPYWDETVYYRFSAAEIDAIEKATYALNDMCLKAVDFVIDNNRFEQIGIAPQYVDYICESWENDEITIYGRFDLAFDGRHPPKLLEYNADTPTSLLEAAVVQWHWMQDLHKDLDQFNSIHERLIEAWARVRQREDSLVYFAALKGNVEDYMTANYLRDTAMQAGLRTEYIEVESIGWNAARQLFLDLRERPIRQCFKLYPWEWMLVESFGPSLKLNTTRWLEPPWKAILSNKGILAILHEMFPQSPHIPPAGFEPIGNSYVRKPLHGREGANIQVVQNGQIVLETDGVYEGPHVYQELVPLQMFGGNYPVIGSWMVNGYACGMGIREDTSPVTQNTSRFVPHVFDP